MSKLRIGHAIIAGKLCFAERAGGIGRRTRLPPRKEIGPRMGAFRKPHFWNEEGKGKASARLSPPARTG